jgi:hypothetical protein
VTWAITSLAGGVGAAPAERIVLLLLALPIAAFGLSILVAVNLDVLDVVSSFAGLVSGSLKATLRPPLAYLGRHRVRSSLVTSALAIVVALVTAFAAYVATYKPDYARDSAGWQARVWSPDAPLSSSVSLPATSRQETIASRYYHGPVRIESPDLPAASGFHQQSLLLFGLDDRQLDGRILPLVSREARYRDDRAVWQALGRDPTLAVSGTDAPGSTIWLQGGQGMVGLHVIASTTYGSPLLPGVIASTRGLAPFEASPAGMVMLLDWPAGQDTAAMTRQMRALVAGEGADATSVQELLDAQFARNQGFLAFSLALLRAGLLIGVFSVGAVALRAAGERRRLIASLRMLGYRPAQVVAGLATEAVLGVTVGVAVGLVVGYGIGVPAFRQQMLGEFWPDPATLATALTFIYAAVLLVTVAPALHAAHRRPAEAVRIT